MPAMAAMLHDVRNSPALTIMGHPARGEKHRTRTALSKDRSMASQASRRELRTMLSPGAALLLPGVANALAARIVADQGFAAAYVTGAGIANTFLGVDRK